MTVTVKKNLETKRGLSDRGWERAGRKMVSAPDSSGRVGVDCLPSTLDGVIKLIRLDSI